MCETAAGRRKKTMMWGEIIIKIKNKIYLYHRISGMHFKLDIGYYRAYDCFY
jgi:hypothetical protein